MVKEIENIKKLSDKNKDLRNYFTLSPLKQSFKNIGLETYQENSKENINQNGSLNLQQNGFLIVPPSESQIGNNNDEEFDLFEFLRTTDYQATAIKQGQDNNEYFNKIRR